MKYLIYAIVVVALLFPIALFYGQEEIVFDGYWWSTLTDLEKLRFVQGFIIVANVEIPARPYYSSLYHYQRAKKSQKEIDTLMIAYMRWRPYDKTFSYYWGRIDSYYKLTGDLKKEVWRIMYDLRTPFPIKD